MEHTIIRALLDKYFLAETTVEEERTLAAYFRGPEIDPGLEPFRDLFAYFQEEAGLEATLSLGSDFENRILERIAREEATVGTAQSPRVFSLRHWFNPAYAAAAAVILSIGLFIMYQPSNHDNPYTRPATTPNRGAPVAATAQIPYTSPTLLRSAAPSGVFSIKDTYDDPQQALAAIRHALLTASTRMNQGKNITQKNMDRLKKLNYGQL